MLKITIGFFLGIVLFLQLRALPSSLFLFVLLPCLIFIRFKPLRFIIFFILGFLWSWFRADLILSNELDKEIEGKMIQVHGVVSSLPQLTQFGQRFQLEIKQTIAFGNKIYSLPKRVQLSWNEFEELIKPGQIISCYVKLKRPYGFFNIGTFDYEFYLFHQGIRASGYVVNKKGCEITNQQTILSVDNIRYRLRSSIDNESLSQNDIKHLIIGLLIGDKSSITHQQWQVLQKTGTSHLLAISGLHIGLVFGLGFYLTNFLSRLFPWLILSIPAQRLGLVVGLIFAVFYSALAGFALPTQRAIIMLCITCLSIWFYNILSIRTLMSISLFIILLLDPFSIYTPSFWLSFMAVSLIIYGMAYRINVNNIWWSWGRAQWLILVGLMPFVIFWFQIISEFSFIANSIAIPLVSMCVVPLVLVYAFLDLLLPSLSTYALTLLEFTMSILWSFLEFICFLPNLDISVTSPNLLTVLISVIAILWFLLPQGFPTKYLSCILIMPLFFPAINKPVEKELWMHVLDVGQGTAIIIQTTNQTVLYDTGAKFSEKFNAGSAVILPVMQALGISKIDKLIVSHADNDHIGGLAAIVNAMPIDEILFNGELNKNSTDSWKQSPCSPMQSWEKDQITFKILHPGRMQNLHELSKNQSSCVLQITFGSKRILLPGDIDYKIELDLIEQYSSNLESDILLVPHHGSKTSSSEPFIDTVNAKYALITNGYRNRFGFPKQVIIDRYQNRNVAILSTVESGMISFRLQNDELKVSQYRAEHRRFWHTIP